MRQRPVRLLQQRQYLIDRGTLRKFSDGNLSRHKIDPNRLAFMMCASLATQWQSAGPFTDDSNPLSEFADNFAALNCCQSLINTPVDVF